MVQRATVQRPTGGITNTPQQFFGNDVNRVGVVISSAYAVAFLVGFSDVPPVNSDIYLPANQSPVLLTLQDWGEMIQLPIWGWLATASSARCAITVLTALPQDMKAYLDGVDIK